MAEITNWLNTRSSGIGLTTEGYFRSLLAHIRELQKHLNQTIADDCETDTRCRELLKQWDKSDSYGVEPLEVVIERALKDLRR